MEEGVLIFETIAGILKNYFDDLKLSTKHFIESSEMTTG